MNEPIETFKTRFNKAINIRDIKPVELSEKSSISKSTISHYMSGYTKPKSDKLYMLAMALNVNEAWLMGYDVPMERQTETITFDEKPDDTPLNEALNKISTNNLNLTDEEAEKVKEFVKILKSNKHSSLVNLFLNAAHEIEGATEEDKKQSDALMENDDFWK